MRALFPVAFVLALQLACIGGGDDDATETPDGTPTIDDLRVSTPSLLIDAPRTIDGLFTFTDSDANINELHVVIKNPAGDVADEATAALPFEGTSEGEGSFSLNLTPDVVGAWTLQAWLVDADGNRSERATVTMDVQGFSDATNACAATGLDCTGKGICYNLTDTTCAYLADYGLTRPECDDIETTRVAPICVSSTTDPDAALLTDDNRCSFVQYWANPTDFPIDCRCSEGAFTDVCQRPYELEPVISFGSGPRMRDLASTVQAWRGVGVGREWLLPVMWSTASHPDQTMIFAIHLDTGDRRYFSGAYNDPRLGFATVGDGDDFVQVMDIKMGPDNQLYAVGATSDIAAPKLWRIDPVTGDRTLIFDADTAAPEELCPNLSTLPGRREVQMTPEGWAMDDQGRFYFSNVGMPGPSIVRLTIDGSGTSCDYLTRVTDCPTCTTQDNVGGGYSEIQFDMRAFEVVGDVLYTVSDTKLLQVDLNTGDRMLLSNGKDLGGLGGGPINAEALGDRWSMWDPWREVVWTTGILGGSGAIVVEPDTGDRVTWPCWHPTEGLLAGCNGVGKALVPGPLNFGGMVLDPEEPHDAFFAHDLMSVVKYDVTTGNAYIFSL